MHKPTSHYCNGQLRKHNLKFTNMKQFSLEEYLKNPSRKVVTREGRSARIICTDAKEGYPVVALIALEGEHGGYEKPETYTKDGRCYVGIPTDLDLFFAPEKHEGWINVYKNESGCYVLGAGILKSKEDAEDCRGRRRVATVKLEWEE